MLNMASLQELPFGLVELDAAGTVLYFNPDNKEAAQPAPSLVGRNFFTDVKPVAEAEEFQRQIRSFRRGKAPSQSFNFTFEAGGDGSLAVRVLLARIHEQSVDGGRDSLFVHIRKNAQWHERSAAA